MLELNVPLNYLRENFIVSFKVDVAALMPFLIIAASTTDIDATPRLTIAT